MSITVAHKICELLFRIYSSVILELTMSTQKVTPCSKNASRAALLFGLAFTKANSFTIDNGRASTRRSVTVGQGSIDGRQCLKKSASCPDLGSELRMISLDMPCIDVHSPAKLLENIGSSMLLAGADTAKTTAIEADAMNWMAHALLDFSGRWTQATVTLRSAEVIGRLMILGQTLLPGHHMLPDELVIQLGFLAISSNALYKVVEPKIKASKESKFLTAPDRKAFRSLFKPAGISWEKYRELHLDTMEWVNLKPGEVILSNESKDDDAMFWLYDGEADLECGHIGSRTLSAKDTLGSSLLFGDERLAEALEFSAVSSDDCNAASTKTTVVSGAAGARLLKISISNLKEALKYDKALTPSVNRLLFHSLQEKLKVSRVGLSTATTKSAAA